MNTKKHSLSGASADEITFLEMAQLSNTIYFKERDSQTMKIQEGDQVVEYTILRVIDFTSARKAMTVVAQRNDGKVFVFTKGADSSIIPKLASKSQFEDETIQKMDNMADQGLRTLLFAYKELTVSDLESLKHEKPEYFESDLTLLGATGLEDLLQEDVKNCISEFKLARCKVWMLTGDKGETAKNIAISCGIVDLDKQEVLKC